MRVEPRPFAEPGSAPVVEMHSGRVELLEAFADEWRAMCAGGDADLPFYRPEWFVAHTRAYEGNPRLELITARRGGRLIAVLPVVRDRVTFSGVPVRRIRGLANETTERFDMACRDGETDAAVEAIWAFLRTERWGVLDFPQAPIGGALDRLIARASRDGFPVGRREAKRSPYIPLNGPVSDTVAIGRSYNLRRTLRKTLRRIRGSETLRLHRSERAEPDELERFCTMENAGWKQDGGETLESNEGLREFTYQLAAQAEQLGYLSIYTLEFEGQIVASQIGLTCGSRYVVPRCAHDEGYREISPGHLLVNAVLGDLSGRGVTQFEFLGSDLEWKQRWTDKGYDHAYLYVFRPSPLGRFMRWFKFTLKPAVRKLVARA